VIKNFPSEIDNFRRPFHGHVVSFRKPWYKIAYADGDFEEMTLKQVRDHLASNPKHRPARTPSAAGSSSPSVAQNRGGDCPTFAKN
jgi:hypothetical protein